MRRPSIAAILVAIACTVGCTSHDVNEAIEVIVTDPQSTATCIDVAAWSQPNNQVTTAKFPSTGSAPYRVAIYPGGALGSDITVQAFGYTGNGCAGLASESTPETGHFGTTSTIAVSLAALGTSDGGDAGFDAGFDGGSDAGADAGSDAGLDAGVDAGMDAGLCPAQPCGTGFVCDQTGKCDPDFGYTPTNWTSSNVTSVNGALDVTCSQTVDTGPVNGAGALTICGTTLRVVDTTQVGGNGPDIVLVPVGGLTVEANKTLTFIGDKPVVFAVYGNANVMGTLTASAQGDAGPGADVDTGCNAQDGSGNVGGGGGAFGHNGGNGGNQGGGQGGGGTSIGAAATLAPLEGGCSGGTGGGGEAPGGAGGALQLSVSKTLTVPSSGVVAAAGNGGAGGAPTNGGAGGGSGGGILLEAGSSLSISGAVTANGGAGGGGGGNSPAGSPGSPGSVSSTTAAAGGPGGGNGGVGGNGGAGTSGAAQSGSSGNGGSAGGGGGGGGVGYLRLNGHGGGCSFSSGTLSGQISKAGGC